MQQWRRFVSCYTFYYCERMGKTTQKAGNVSLIYQAHNAPQKHTPCNTHAACFFIHLLIYAARHT